MRYWPRPAVLCIKGLCSGVSILQEFIIQLTEEWRFVCSVKTDTEHCYTSSYFLQFMSKF